MPTRSRSETAFGSLSSGLAARIPSEPILQISNEVFFGEQLPGSLKVSFGDTEDIEELAGNYWFQEVDTKGGESVFELVGAFLRHGNHEENHAVQFLTEKRPRFRISEIHELNVNSAIEELRKTNGLSGTFNEDEKGATTENESKKSIDDVPRNPVFVKIGERTIDVDASLRMTFRNAANSSGQVSKCRLRDLLVDLDLELDEEELQEAQMAFPGDQIDFETFRNWWMN